MGSNVNVTRLAGTPPLLVILPSNCLLNVATRVRPSYSIYNTICRVRDILSDLHPLANRRCWLQLAEIGRCCMLLMISPSPFLPVIKEACKLRGVAASSTGTFPMPNATVEDDAKILELLRREGVE